MYSIILGFAVETVFGWILSGPVFNISSNSTTISLEVEQSYKDTSTSRLCKAKELSKKTSKSTATTIQTGMLVVVREDNLSPNECILGTVAAVRMTKMATKMRTKRPISKLIIVPSN